MAGHVAHRIGFDLARAQAVEETHGETMGDQRTGAGVMGVQNVAGPVGLDDMAEAGGDFGYRGVPRDRLEASLALGADAPERLFQALALVENDAIVKNLAFCAQLATAEEMLLVAAHRNDAAVLAQHFDAAGIVAIARAGGFDNFFVYGHIASSGLEATNLEHFQ